LFVKRYLIARIGWSKSPEGIQGGFSPTGSLQTKFLVPMWRFPRLIFALWQKKLTTSLGWKKINQIVFRL
jgi:hypothetical protein